MRGNLYEMARGLSIIFFFILLMAIMKTMNFQAGAMTGAITMDTQMSLMGLIFVLTLLAGFMAVFFRNKFGFN